MNLEWQNVLNEFVLFTITLSAPEVPAGLKVAGKMARDSDNVDERLTDSGSEISSDKTSSSSSSEESDDGLVATT